MTKKKSKTCLDCGFLTIRGAELSKATRLMLSCLGTNSQSTMPANPEQAFCYKNLWVNYDLSYSGDSLIGVIEELQEDRDQCSGFLSYEAGFAPEQHIEHQIELRKERLQWKIARFSFFGGFVGGVAATILKWILDLAVK